MEALDSLGIDWKLLIAQAVNFLILVLVLWKFLYNPLVGMLSNRKAKIEQGMKDADEARIKLEQTNIETRKILSEASLESEKIVKAAKKEMEEETKLKLTEAQKKAEEIVENSRNLAAEEQKKIVEKAKREISELAISISEKILEKDIDSGSANKAIEKI